MPKKLSNDGLKILALILMTIDHIGYYLFPSVIFLRLIGRLSFPIFAFMISESCKYTKNKKEYLKRMGIFALITQAIMYPITQLTYLYVPVTFFIGIILTYIVQDIKKNFYSAYTNFWDKFKGIFLLFVITIIILYISSITFLDYKLWGCYTPAIISLCHWNKELPKHLKKYDKLSIKLCLLTISLFLIQTMTNQYQIYSLFALIPLCFYSGERKNIVPKNFFYIYYPVHMITLFIFSQI